MMYVWIGIAIVGIILYMFPSVLQQLVLKTFEGFENTRNPINPINPINQEKNDIDSLVTKLHTILQPQNSTMFVTPDLTGGNIPNDSERIQSSPGIANEIPKSYSDMLHQGSAFNTTKATQPSKDAFQEVRATPSKNSNAPVLDETTYIRKDTTTSCPNLKEYARKDNTPSCPDLRDYVRKDKIPSCPSLKDYVRKDMVPSCPDMRNFIRKDSIPCWGCKLG